MYSLCVKAATLLLWGHLAKAQEATTESLSETEQQGDKGHANLMTLTTDCTEQTLRDTVLKTQVTASSGETGDDLSGDIDHIWCIDRTNT